jgi:hypothetical protein
VLYEGASSGVQRSNYRKTDKVTGTIKFLMGYEGLGFLVKHSLWGTPSTTGPSGAIYTHTFALGLNAPTGGLTIEQVLGNGSAEVFEGCRINTAKFSIQAAGMIEVELGILGETSAGRTSAGSPTFTTNELDVLHNQAGSLSWNSVTFSNVVKSITWSIDNKLAERHLLGSLIPSEPKPSAIREVKIEAELEYNSDDLQSGFIGTTESDATLTFTGTSSRSIVFALHNAYVEENGTGPEQFGVLTESATLRGQDDGTDLGFKITIANTQTTATAA